MLYTKIFSLTALAATAFADSASIQAAIAKIQAATTTLDTAVTGWSGGPLGAIPITAKSVGLLKDIHDGTKVAKASEPLDAEGAFGIAGPTQALAEEVTTALGHIVAAKPKFDKLLLSPAILLNLELQQTASDEFSDAVIDKVPEQIKEIARSLTQPIDDAFAKAIDAYRLIQ